MRGKTPPAGRWERHRRVRCHQPRTDYPESKSVNESGWTAGPAVSDTVPPHRRFPVCATRADCCSASNIWGATADQKRNAEPKHAANPFPPLPPVPVIPRSNPTWAPICTVPLAACQNQREKNCQIATSTAAKCPLHQNADRSSLRSRQSCNNFRELSYWQWTRSLEMWNVSQLCTSFCKMHWSFEEFLATFHYNLSFRGILFLSFLLRACNLNIWPTGHLKRFACALKIIAQGNM